MLRKRVRLLQACCCLFVNSDCVQISYIAGAKGSIWFETGLARDFIDFFFCPLVTLDWFRCCGWYACAWDFRRCCRCTDKHYRYIDRIFLLQTNNSEYHVAGARADAERKGQVSAGVLLSLCSDCVQISCIAGAKGSIWFDIGLARDFIDFFFCPLSRLIDSGAADDMHAPEISGDAAGAPTDICPPLDNLVQALDTYR